MSKVNDKVVQAVYQKFTGATDGVKSVWPMDKMRLVQFCADYHSKGGTRFMTHDVTIGQRNVYGEWTVLGSDGWLMSEPRTHNIVFIDPTDAPENWRRMEQPRVIDDETLGLVLAQMFQDDEIQKYMNPVHHTLVRLARYNFGGWEMSPWYLTYNETTHRWNVVSSKSIDFDLNEIERSFGARIKNEVYMTMAHTTVSELQYTRECGKPEFVADLDMILRDNWAKVEAVMVELDKVW